MKNHILHLLLFFLLVDIGASAQQYKKDAEKQFLHYSNLVIKKDFRSASDFIIEDLFSIVPKEQMITAMEKVFNLPGFDFFIDSPQVLQVGDSRKVDSALFLKLKYSNILRMKFDTSTDATQPDSSQAESELLTMTLQSKFGEENVTYNKETGYYSIYSVKDVIAKSTDLKDWKFIVMEEDKMPFLKKLVPKEFLE